MAAPMQVPWPHEDLIRRVALALRVAKRAIKYLGRNGYREEDDPEDSFGPDKPLAETAMLLYVAAAIGKAARRELRVDELCLLLAPLARSPRTALAIAQHPTICLQLAMPHILLTRLGFGDARFDRLLTLSQESPASRGREVLPHRALEGHWLRSLWSATPPGSELTDAVASSVMGHSLDLLWGSRDDAYAYTHAFMYFTDFGRDIRPLPRARSELLDDSACLLMHCLLAEDFDLAVEVLMTWPLTSAPWTPAAVFGFRVLAELEDRVGYVPSGNGVPERLYHLTGAARTKYALAASYHTAYVMGMLCALAAGQGRAPPNEIAGSLAPTTLIESLLSMIPAADTPWRATFGKLRPMEQRALAPALLDLALLTKIRNHDLPSTVALLELASQHGVSDAPVCAQAAQLLERVAACAE
jgi:hypothetical protein